jgi:hypothetical protein
MSAYTATQPTTVTPEYSLNRTAWYQSVRLLAAFDEALTASRMLLAVDWGLRLPAQASAAMNVQDWVKRIADEDPSSPYADMARDAAWGFDHNHPYSTVDEILLALGNVDCLAAYDDRDGWWQPETKPAYAA